MGEHSPRRAEGDGLAGACRSEGLDAAVPRRGEPVCAPGGPGEPHPCHPHRTLDQVCNDSCLEFFFAPLEEDARYFNFEWNPLKSLNLGFGGTRPTRVRQIVKKMDELFCPQSWQEENTWGITFRIPAEFVGRYFPGFTYSGTCCANVYKCGDETEHPHYLAWSPVTSDKPDFHRRGDFGTLVFE